MDKKLELQNERVKRAAERMPTVGLRNSFKAFGYRADVGLSTDQYLVIHGYSMATMAKISKQHGYGRSRAQIWADLKLFEDCRVAARQHGKRQDGQQRQPPDMIVLRLDPAFAHGVRCWVAELMGWLLGRSWP